jgi:hypothetical protein
VFPGDRQKRQQMSGSIPFRARLAPVGFASVADQGSRVPPFDFRAGSFPSTAWRPGLGANGRSEPMLPASLSTPNTPASGAPSAGVIGDKNRPNQATFSSTACGQNGHADVIAARNIRCRAEAARVTRP